VDADPSAGLGKEREQERTRTLSDDELRALIRGFDPTRYGRAVRLLAYTGIRRDETLGAEWTWLDSEAATLTIPAAAEKTGQTGAARRVVASPQALAARRAEEGSSRRGAARVDLRHEGWEAPTLRTC
jgi:integrase